MTLPIMKVLSGVLGALGHPRLLALLCAVLIPLSSYLAARQVVASRRLVELEAALDRDTHIPVGARVGPLTGFSLTGERSELAIATSARGAVVFGVSNSCPYCLAELDAHRALAEQAVSGGLQVFWVLRDTLSLAREGPYAKAGLLGTFLVEPVNATYRAVGLGFVPQTLVIGADGQVDAVWRGVLGSSGQTNISEAIQRASLREANQQR